MKISPEILNLIKTIAYSVAVVVIPILTKYIAGLLNAKKESIKDTNDASLKNNLIYTAIDIIQRCVDMVSQTYVDSLKKEGKFDKKAQKEALKKAVDNSKKFISEDVKGVIVEYYGDVDAWIKVQIESYIGSSKTTE